MLPEEAYVAVLDAYVFAYRNAKRSRSASADKVLEVVEGMKSILSMMHRHDSKAAPSGDAFPRTVDPYATVLHMLLEVTLDEPPDTCEGAKWCQHSLEVLDALESNPRLVSQQQDQHQNHARARIVQYNRVLKGLAYGTPSTCTAAVRLLAALSEDSLVSRTLVLDLGGGVGDVGVTLGPGVFPNARSFVTVLTSPCFCRPASRNDTLRRKLLGIALELGVYEGYLESSLKRAWGEKELARLRNGN